jgi:FkbM family methyltransferase
MHYRPQRGRWRIASWLLRGRLYGRADLSDEYLVEAMPEGKILRCRHGMRVRMRPDPLYIGPYLFGEYEPGNTRCYTLLVKPGDIVLDVGANFGWYSALLARHVGRTGTVHAIEPVPDAIEMLRDTLRINGLHESVEVHPVGLGSGSGEFTVYTFAGLPLGHASAVDLGRPDARPYTCQVRALDEFIQTLGLERLDFIKVDVEGFEADVFAGGTELLSTDEAPVVAFETNIECLTARGMRCVEVQDRLRAMGFERFDRIRPDGTLAPVRGDLAEDSADYLATKPAHGPRLAAAGLI